MGDLLLVAALLVLFGVAVGFALGLWASLVIAIWLGGRMAHKELVMLLRETYNYPEWAAEQVAKRLRGTA